MSRYHTELSYTHVSLPHSTVAWLEYLRLLVHGSAVSFILVSGNHLVHIDSDRGQDAVQLLHGLLGQGGLSAQDPGQLHAEQAEVCAAVDQRVALIVGGQHPVGTGGRCCRRDQYESLLEYSAQK